MRPRQTKLIWTAINLDEIGLMACDASTTYNYPDFAGFIMQLMENNATVRPIFSYFGIYYIYIWL